jgi:stage II sporulation protein D
MRKHPYLNIAFLAVVALALVAGAYTLLRPPASKPGPGDPPPAPLAAPRPIPGVPLFDAGKYKSEPVVSIWRADRGGGRDELPLERYLEGVIAQEMDPAWPLEALKAQAIASRTLTINAIEAGTIRRLHNTDVSTAKEELQAYAPQKVNENVREAVRVSRGQILLYAGSLVNAVYHDSNGQINATREESFPREIPQPTPYFQPVTDSSYRYTPLSSQYWTVDIPGREVAAAVGHRGNPGDIVILEKGPSGRILFIGTAAEKIYGADFRKTIGFDRLKSTLIDDMTYDGSRFTFKGRGWGNGVGLCQWGAYTYAQDGWKAEDILRHYYVDTNIQKIWD